MKKIVTILLMVSLLMTIKIPTLASTTGLGPEVEHAISKGIILGDHNGEYNLSHTLKRKELAALIARMLKLEDDVNIQFQDVNFNHSLGKEMRAVASKGIMKGTTQGDFRPEQNVSREEVAVIMSNTLSLYGKKDTNQVELLDPKSQFYLETGITSVKHAFHYEVVNGFNYNKENQTVLFKPREHATRGQGAAILYRLSQALEQVEVKPTPKPPAVKTYQLVSFDGKSHQSINKSFDDYESAVIEMKKNSKSNAVVKNDKVVAIKNGYAYKNTVNSTINFYLDSKLSNRLTYVAAGTELEVIENGEKAVKVRLAGVDGYVSATEVVFKPYGSVESRRHYSVSSYGTLLQHVYNHRTSILSGGFELGAAHPNMKKGEKYISSDGITFTSTQTGIQTKHYPYFQYLSARVKTNYSAEELDQIIMKRLVSIDKPGNYAGATTKSKLIGLGQDLKDLEQEYNLSALFILSVAMHESGYGMSAHAQKNNNLFGLKVYDTTPTQGPSFPTPKANIVQFIEEFINGKYSVPGHFAAYGVAPGNKAMGITVFYASDPDWGAKVASYMQRSDALLGGKELNRNIKRGIVKAKTASVNIRQEIGTSTNVIYSYIPRNKDFTMQYPVAIAEEKKHTDGYVWYKIYSDHPSYEFGWVRSDLVEVIK